MTTGRLSDYTRNTVYYFLALPLSDFAKIRFTCMHQEMRGRILQRSPDVIPHFT